MPQRVHQHPNLIYSPGTQVVSLVAVRHAGGEQLHPRGAVGVIVRAPADGIVTLTNDDMFFSGGTLIIDHGHGLSSTFIHLNAILVKDGQRVRQGDVIAEVGATGRVSGPHLHWGMNLLSKRLDPQLLVPPMTP